MAQNSQKNIQLLCTFLALLFVDSALGDVQSLSNKLNNIARSSEISTLEDFGHFKLSSKEYYELRSNACKYYSDAKSLIDKRRLTSAEEIVLAHAMRGLPINSYLNWAETALVAYDKKTISSDFVMLVYFPALNDKPELYLAYRDTRIEKVYRELKKHRVEFRNKLSGIEGLLSGETAKWIVNYRTGTQLPIPKVDLKEKCKR